MLLRKPGEKSQEMVVPDFNGDLEKGRVPGQGNE